jgi:hypothetical protein
LSSLLAAAVAGFFVAMPDKNASIDDGTTIHLANAE